MASHPLGEALRAYFTEMAKYSYSYMEYRPSTVQKADAMWGSEGAEEYRKALSFFGNWDIIDPNEHPPSQYFRGHDDAQVERIMNEIVQAIHLWILLYGEPFEDQPYAINPRNVNLRYVSPSLSHDAEVVDNLYPSFGQENGDDGS